MKKILKYLFSLILSAVFLYIAFLNVNFSQVIEYISHASIGWILILICVMLLSHYLRALRWKIILRSVKKDTSIKYLFGALMVGYGVNAVVPRLGEVSRAVLLGKWEGVSKSSMFGTVIVERVIDVIFLAISVIISALIWSGSLYHSFPWLKTSLYVTIFLMTAIILFLYLIIKFKEKFYGLLINLLSKISPKIATKAGHIFEMLIKGFGSLKGIKNYSITIFLSIIIMIFYALSAYIGFYTVGMESIKPVTFGMAWILMSISGIGIVIPTPGGTGSYHTLAKSTLVLLFGFGEEISLTYAILTHIISYFIFIVSALLIYFIMDKRQDNFFKMGEKELEKI